MVACPPDECVLWRGVGSGRMLMGELVLHSGSHCHKRLASPDGDRILHALQHDESNVAAVTFHSKHSTV